jgi:RNA polymerase sigma-70 factor (ECF subfamily)
VAANSQWDNEGQEKLGRADTLRPDSDALWDKRTMDRVAAGEEGALLLIYDRYSRLVFSVALHVLKQKHEAEDIAQEVFLHLWRNAKSYNVERGGLAGWLAIITRHRAIDTLRRRSRECGLEADSGADGNFHREAELSEAVTRLAAALPSMPIPQRVALGLAYFSGLSHSEISLRTGEPLGTVKSRIRMALEFLRKTLVNRETSESSLAIDLMRRQKRK